VPPLLLKAEKPETLWSIVGRRNMFSSVL
jgi:hypothetical protein